MSDTSSTLNRRARMPVFVLLLVAAFSILYPIVFIGSAAFRTKADYLADPFGIPKEWTLQNFIVLVNNYGIGQAALNSIGVVLVSLTLVLLIASTAGYAMAKLPLPGFRWINATFVSVMLIPSQVLIIPIYLMLSRLGLVGDHAGLVLVYVVTGLPFTVFFLTTTFRSIDDSVLEAARLDGAGFVRTFRSIVLPMGGAGIATVAVLQFLGMWNELLFAYILLPDSTKTLLTPALAGIGGRYVTDQPLVSAGLLLTALPPLLLLAFTSRYIVVGINAGSVR